MAELPKDWPSPEQFNKLLDRCGGLFAYAATIIQFISEESVDGVRDPVGRLSEILYAIESQPTTDGTSPYPELDRLYLSILQRAALKKTREGHIERIRCVIATIMCLRYELPMEILSKFLSMAEGDICDVLRDLHSVVDTYSFLVQLFHPSFQDLIQDNARCTDRRFFVDIPAHEHFMALRCINAIRNGRLWDYNTHFYVRSSWTSHLRSGACRGLSDELVQELIWLIGDKDELVDLYNADQDDANEDIIPFVRSLVEEHRPKESETLLGLLRDAEANEQIAGARKRFIGRHTEEGLLHTCI